MSEWDTTHGVNTMSYLQQGMASLMNIETRMPRKRDIFAMSFMNGYCSGLKTPPTEDAIEQLARLSYRVADAMIEVSKEEA